MRLYVYPSTPNTGTALQVPEGVDGRAVDADLEVQVVAETAAGAARIADHLALCDLIADAGRVAGLVCVAGGEPAAVVDAGVVAVAAGRRREDRRSRPRRADRRSGGHRDVDALVHPSPAPAER